MNANEAKSLIEKAMTPTIEMTDKGFHVPFYILDQLTDAQWNEIKGVKHDVTDKGIYFYA